MKKKLNTGEPEFFSKPSTQHWLEEVKRSVKNPDELGKLIWETPEGFKLNSFYREEDLEGRNQGTLFDHRGWEVRQLIYLDKLMAANQSALKALEGGADAIVFKGSFSPSEKELAALFNQLRLDWFPCHFDFGESNISLIYVLIDFFREKGYAPDSLKGSIFLDPLSDYYLQGNFSYPEAETFKAMKSVFDTGSTELPGYRLIGVNTVHLRNAGANAVLELASGISQITEYLHRLTDLGLSPQQVLSAMQWNAGIGSDYFIEIAKFRAAGILLSNLAAFYGVQQNPLQLNAVSSSRNKTVFDAYNNILRSTSEAMAAAIGGARSITVHPFDDFHQLPDEFSYRLSRNLQLILKDEARIDMVADPAAGSYYIETITNKIAEAAWELFLEMEKQGGFLQSLRNKFIQQRIMNLSDNEMKNFMSGQKVLVGTNKFANKTEQMPPGVREIDKPFRGDQLEIVPVDPVRLAEKLELERQKLSNPA